MKIDMSSHNSGIWIMLALDLVFLGAVIYAFKCQSTPSELRTILSGAFSGWNGALLLALRGGGDKKE